MEFRQFGSKYIIRLEKGEEIIESLTKLCKDNNIKLGLVSGIGAVNKITIGAFEPDTKKYHQKEMEGIFEIIALTGNTSTMNDEVYLHLHITVSDHDCQAFGGHLNKAVISATAEIIIDTMDGQIDRAFSDEIGLNLLKFN